jgi:cytochrome c-type biogenesis protein CcmH/NrfG
MAMSATGGILLFSSHRKQIWPAVAAAAVLGLAGYAWQGQPQLAASPAKQIKAETVAAESFLTMRSDMDSRFGAGKQWLILSDSQARNGNYAYAAAFIEAGLRQHPKNGDLWAGMGVILMLAADGKMTPPAELAFAKARIYAPINRAPDYFAGLDALFEGRPADTLAIWQKLVDGAPANSVWKPKLESQLSGLKSMLQSAQPVDVK